MTETVWIRSSLAAALALGGIAVLHVAGCGSSAATTPPSAAASQGQGDTSAPGDVGMDGKRHRRPPPPEAFAACKDKAIGADCTATMHDRELHGKCEAPPEGSPQSGPACRPEGGPHGRHHGPPPEIVFAACDGKGAGDACSVAFERGTVQGSCMAPRMDGGAGRLLCAAAHGHKHADAGGGT
jgi:spore coat protein H